ncbi:helix-turn-helix domain-containing protein [Parasphingopyxis lamellibrachiae]|uniref:Xre family transcriptional regulator n=1 Tax=Parasphingopyxis lamellibrachiae TaxID=680125 RepID=A0A3D9FBL1_9SPHN|nr:XRE family transcriptional regulator [Parasphingopyxis lamellibrachiae]RED15195.1 Xre family transcriptional regulator [Parasphingopyxis lamellibrachiae]
MKARLYAGSRLRTIRQRRELDQAGFARTLGISVSYLSQIENDARPITASVTEALERHFPSEWNEPPRDEYERRLAAIREAISDPLFSETPLPAPALSRFVEQYPQLADRMVALHSAYRLAEERRHALGDVIDSTDAESRGDGRQFPWEETRDWFHAVGNYVDTVDVAAERIAAKCSQDNRVTEEALIERLGSKHGLSVRFVSDDTAATALREYDRANRCVSISAILPRPSRTFQLAHQLALIELIEPITAIVRGANLQSEASEKLLTVGLGNYAAGAIVMPYARFRDAARALRHDVDRLANRFGVSFEQACHRLSTLQRPGMRGVPMFFFRIDMAGNITKRHSATKMQFARFGGACPLWIAHEAAASPDKIHVQLAETPDGIRYVTMAMGLVKPSGSFQRPSRRFAVALGCEAEQAADFVYADALDLENPAAATPIGTSCRLCPRRNCDQRAFPPAGHTLLTEIDRREVIPYRL